MDSIKRRAGEESTIIAIYPESKLLKRTGVGDEMHNFHFLKAEKTLNNQGLFAHRLQGKLLLYCRLPTQVANRFFTQKV